MAKVEENPCAQPQLLEVFLLLDRAGLGVFPTASSIPAKLSSTNLVVLASY